MMDSRRDRRYGTRRFRKVRLRVLARDNWTCRVALGCAERATVADHIIPVFPGMTDTMFFALDNLRASCRHHNLARGVAARLERETRGTPQSGNVVTTDYTKDDDDGAA